MYWVLYLEKVEETPEECYNEWGHNDEQEPMVVSNTPRVTAEKNISFLILLSFINDLSGWHTEMDHQ